MIDDYVDEFDLIASIPESFDEAITSKKWTDRRDALAAVLELVTPAKKLAPKATYDNFLSQLKFVVEKDANIHNQALATKIFTAIAIGLKNKFANHAPSIFPILFEKFKEKKVQLRDPLCECVDAFGKTINLEVIIDEVVNAMGKPNPSIKQQVDNFVFRMMVCFTSANQPKKFVKAVVPVLVKHAEDSDKDVRDSALLALGSIGRLTGESILNTLIGNLTGDALKMAKVKEGTEKAIALHNEYVATIAPPAASASVATVSVPANGAVVTNVTQQPKAVSDDFDFLDPVDVLALLPETFKANVESKKWQERKETLESLLELLQMHRKLDTKTSYHEIVETLAYVINKDTNIMIAAVAAKCVTLLAQGLRTKFAQHVPTFSPFIFDKFKEKKVILRDPLVAMLDELYAISSIDVFVDDIVAALGKANPNIKIQTNLFLYRIFKGFNLQTAPKKHVKALTPLIAKCTGESDPEAREAAFSALGAIMKAIGKVNAMTMLGDIANDKTKMGQIEKFYNQAVQESGVEIVSEMVQSIHKSAPVAPPKEQVVKVAPPVASAGSEPDNEPLKPMPKAEEKAKRRVSSRPQSPAPPAAPEPSKEPEGVLSIHSNRANRLKDEKNLKILKWNFKTPDDERIAQLTTQFSDNAKPEFVKLLFAKDFKLNIKALELIHHQLTVDPVAVINNSDLILRWASLRFFDTNPQSLNKTLEVILDLLIAMESSNAKLSDSDVSAFVPYLLLKIGDTKDTVRQLVRRVVSQVTIVNSPTKVLPLIIDVLATKNSRQKVECLSVAEHFLEMFGLTICANPNVMLKTIAGCISERDSTARSNALNCIVVVWRKIGDRVFSLIGNLPAKEKAMLDERIKRAGREPAQINDENNMLRMTPIVTSSRIDVNTTTVVSNNSIDKFDNVTPRTTLRSRSISRNQGYREQNLGDTVTRDFEGGAAAPFRRTIPSHIPVTMHFSIDKKFYNPLPDAPQRFVPSYEGDLQSIQLPPTFPMENYHSTTSSRSDIIVSTRSSNVVSAGFSGDMMADCIDKNLSIMTTENARDVISSSKELVYLFRDQQNYTNYMITKADVIARTIATQFAVVRSVHLSNRSSDTETNQLLRALTNFGTFFVHQNAAVKHILHSSLRLLLSELLRYLTDERTSLIEEHQSLSRSVNVITVKLCEHADINESIAACFALLDEYLSTNAPSKLVELLLKCIFKRSENLVDAEGYCAIHPDRFLILVDALMLRYPKGGNNITERVGDSVRLVTQRLLGVKGDDLEAYLVVLNPRGELKSYMLNCFEKWKTMTKKHPTAKKRTLVELFNMMKENLHHSVVSELYFYLRSHPEDQSEYEELLSTFALKSSVSYYFEEFRNNIKINQPKSFYQLFAEVLNEAGHTLALAGGPMHKFGGSELDVSLPFSLNRTNSNSSSSGILPGSVTQSTPKKGAKRTLPPNVAPINSKQMDYYKKRLSEIKGSHG